MRLSKESQQSPENLSNADKLEQEKIQELESILPDMPRFEGFFNSQSKGKHPFEEDQFQFTEERARGPPHRRDPDPPVVRSAL